MNELTQRVNDQLILLETLQGNLGKDAGNVPSGAGSTASEIYS